MPDEKAKLSRTAYKRGPKPSPADDIFARQTQRIAEMQSERHLVGYHKHFRKGTADDTYFRITRALVVAARRWRKVANERVKELGQTMARWETLFLVAYSDDELTQSELARLISVEGPTMVRMLDVLAKDGLIERRQSDTDRRMTTNRITPKGELVIDEIMAMTNLLRADLLRDIDPDKLTVFLEVLSRILLKLDEMR
jgi:MarR family transcriptional regulator for hemolysin